MLGFASSVTAKVPLSHPSIRKWVLKHRVVEMVEPVVPIAYTSPLEVLPPVPSVPFITTEVDPLYNPMIFTIINLKEIN